MATNGVTPYWSCQNFENTYGDPPHSQPVLNIKSGGPSLVMGSQVDVRSGSRLCENVNEQRRKAVIGCHPEFAPEATLRFHAQR